MSRRAAWALAASLLACQTGSVGPPGSAVVSVEVLRGFAVPRAPLASVPPRVAVLVDVTRSMAEATAAGPTRAAAAIGGAAELIQALPADAELTLRALGGRDGGAACAEPGPAAGAAAGDPRDALVAQLRALAPRAEGSLAAGLEAIRTDLASAGGADGARVVVFTDFEDACGVEPCEAARALVAAGAWVDWFAFGSAPPPACLAALAPPARASGGVAAQLAPELPGFRLLAGDSAADTAPLAAGRAGGAAVSVPSGLVTLVVELDPQERIGPFALAPGESVRVRVLDFPMAVPPQRSWRIEREGERWDASFPDAPAWPEEGRGDE